MTTLTLSLGSCSSCGTLPDGSLTLCGEDYETLDMYKVHSGTRNCSLDLNEHPVYGSLPVGSYHIVPILKGVGLRTPFPEYVELINSATGSKHYAWHNPSPGYTAALGLLFPKSVEWKRFTSLITDTSEVYEIINQPRANKKR